MGQEDGAMNKHNTASMHNGKKRPPFSILPEKPDGAEDWFYTFMCMNIPFYGWRYLKQLVYQEQMTAPKASLPERICTINGYFSGFLWQSQPYLL